MGFLKKLGMNLNSKRVTAVPQTGKGNSHPFGMLDRYVPLSATQAHLYTTLREAVPIIDAAIYKLVRLTLGFEVKCDNLAAQRELERFVKNISVDGNRHGLDTFISSYFEQLLTYGTAVGEVVTSGRKIVALYSANLENIELVRGESPLDVKVYVRDGLGKSVPVTYPDLVLMSVLNPQAGQLGGNSLLKGLPFISSVLLKIYNTIGVNWERVGNVRFAVTYKPQNDALDRAYAKDRAMQVAKEWGEAMNSTGSVKDFIAVGDVQIKVIGADNQIIDSNTPVRQMLEQIVAKTGLPPFMLGLSWSTTERMSSQQADILTSELEAYRKLLEPVILKICNTFLRYNGYNCDPYVEWNDITLQDQTELSRARLYSAQAAKIEQELERQD